MRETPIKPISKNCVEESKTANDNTKILNSFWLANAIIRLATSAIPVREIILGNKYSDFLMGVTTTASIVFEPFSNRIKTPINKKPSIVGSVLISKTINFVGSSPK